MSSNLIGEILETLDSPGGIYITGKPNVPNAKSLYAKLKTDLLCAHRYYLSDAATSTASMYAFNARNVEEQVVKLARPQFPLIWLEWSLSVQLNAVGIENEAESPPSRVGVLIKRQSTPGRFLITPIATIKIPTSTKHVLICPVSILYDTGEYLGDEYNYDLDFICESLIPSLSNLAKKHKIQLTKELCMGLTVKSLAGGFDDSHFIEYEKKSDLANEFGKHAVHILTPIYGAIIKEGIHISTNERRFLLQTVISESILENAGLFRMVSSALALINTKNYVSAAPIKPGMRNPSEDKKIALKGRKNPLYDFIELKVPHTVIIQDLQGTEHEHRDRQRHMVGEHLCYRHNSGNPNCQHHFAKQSETREICLSCGYKRWWRKDHERGNIDLGFKPKASKLVTM